MSKPQADQLWRVLDENGDGDVSQREFEAAFTGMLHARTWTRYCPTCIYTNTCTYCMECNATCDLCSSAGFCANHWVQHPSHEEQTRQYDENTLNYREWLRHHAIVRPLTLAYQSPTLRAGLPISLLGRLRREMRRQALHVAEADKQRQERDLAAMHDAARTTDVPTPDLEQDPTDEEQAGTGWIGKWLQIG
uniref:EF-hand domain-containing protein n=1 Tax=Haptolina brevifila TaxID=156173 RepID=A0A7S2E1Y3_9EUKA